VIDSVEKGWLKSWVKINFKKKKNEDLWRRFLKVYPNHQVRFHWVKGHAGIPENERCDQLAVEASKKKTLLIDEAYENGSSDGELF